MTDQPKPFTDEELDQIAVRLNAMVPAPPFARRLLTELREARQALILARGVLKDDTEELKRLRATRDLAFYCAGGCKAIVPVTWEDSLPGEYRLHAVLLGHRHLPRKERGQSLSAPAVVGPPRLVPAVERPPQLPSEVTDLARVTGDDAAAALVRQVTRLLKVMPAIRLIAILDRYATRLEWLLASGECGQVVITQDVGRRKIGRYHVTTTENPL